MKTGHLDEICWQYNELFSKFGPAKCINIGAANIYIYILNMFKMLGQYCAYLVVLYSMSILH